MRPHLHVDQLAGSPRELDGTRLHMAGQSYEELTGGGAMPTLTSAPQAGGAVAGRLSSLTSQAPQHGIVALVLVAVVVLFLLDKAGFRFAVTAGKR